MDGLDPVLLDIEEQLAVTAGSLEVVTRRCADLRALLDERDDPRLAGATLERLAGALHRRVGPVAAALFDWIAQETRRADAPAPVISSLLGAADDALRDRAVSLAAELARRGLLAADPSLVERIARVDEATPLSSAGLAPVKELLRCGPAGASGGAAADPELALFLGGPSRTVRRLAGRVLDATRGRPALAVVGDRLGAAAAAFLVPYLEHSGATYEDLVDAVPPSGTAPYLEGMRRAERILGPALLREVIGRLGWPRLTWGLSAEACAGVSVGGSFPFVVAPRQARLLADASGAETVWRRHVVVAHGGPAGEGGAAFGPDEQVRRFRRYNVAHAELLDEILAVAPLDRAKALRVLSLADGVVADFEALFADASEDATRVRGVYERLRALVDADLERDAARRELSGETVRRIQMFEEPQRLDDVTTVHGLKRYLHQQGLRLAFRLFRSERAANRTVDLVVAGERDVLRCERPIRYLEFEPTTPVGTARLPFVVSLVAEALGRQLLHERKLPSVTIIGYGNEHQIYVAYRNHPAFIRLDLSPPLRGGMIELEYYAVSQYEMDHHPDLSLQGIQRVLRELDFDVSKDGLRLRARYDKERAADLGDVIAKARSVFDLLPYLMDVDWVIGDLDHPPAARTEVAAAWARFFAQWGAIPAPEVLSGSRRRIVVGVEPDPAGPREVVWDGAGAYRDRFSGTPPDAFGDALHEVLDRRGLGHLASALPPRGGWGQRLLEDAVLRPLAESVRRGEVRESDGELQPAPRELFWREHEAERFAALLAAGGRELAEAVEMASLVRGVERQVRFHTSGSVNGHAVQAGSLPIPPQPVGLFVLRDEHGIVRLAVAASGRALSRTRAASSDPWVARDELGVPELARTLRAYNYVGPGPERAAAPGDDEVAEIRRRFGAASPAPVSRGTSGEQLVPATIAAPGRATGLAAFHAAGRPPAELDGAVLLARAVRPEDGPWLTHAAAIVSTGGGVLSHVGLIALELEKPALIVEGHWSAAPSGAEVLVYRCPQWRETSSQVGGYQVICRHELRHSEETLAEGTVVTVDAEGGALVVLGSDAQALSLHHGLYQLESASTALAVARPGPEVLACRGRLVRAVHQLERLVARLERPALVRHAVRELLTLPRGPSAPEGRASRAQLLARLLRNPACARVARESAERRLDDLRTRLGAAARVAVEDVPVLATPAEVVFVRLGVRRIHGTLVDALELTGAGGEPPPRDALDRLDAACVGRLERLRVSISERAEAAAGRPQERWRLRHLLPRLAQVTEVLEGVDAPAERSGPAAALARADEGRVRELAPARVLPASAGGLELRSLVGGKAAHLGEIARALGEGAVPPWFTVTDRAFREALSAPVPGTVLGALGLPAAGRLEEAIGEVTAHAGWDARRQANAIRELWQAILLPAPLSAEIAAAYASLAAAAGADPPVAIRSSSREEDGEDAAWAGQFDTFLFVRGVEAVLDHVKLAWAGFWTERAIDQRRLRAEPPLTCGGGIVVQRMVPARASGVLHTVCASTGQLREMVVNAGLGLGEGVVSGTVDVDHVLVAKGDLASGDLRVQYRVGDKREQIVWDRERGSGTRREETRYHQRLRPALEYVELRELVTAAARLEEAFLEPLDVEFAIDGRELRILQARPMPIFDAAWREALARHPLRPPGSSRRREAP